MRIGSSLAAAVLLSIALVTANPLASRAGEPAKQCAVGDRVVQKNREFKIRTDEDGGSVRAVPIGSWHVDKVENGKISLWSGSFGSGWVKTDQVVRVDDAMKFFSDRIRDNPQDAFAHVMLAVLWRDKGEFDKALADSNDAIRIDPRAAITYETRAAVWLDKSEPKKALADCDEALRLDAQNVLALVRRGTAFMDMNQTDKALEEFNRAIQLDPAQSMAHVDRGWAWIEKKEYEKALADFSEAIRINPHDGTALRNRAASWAVKRRYDQSIADYSAAIRLDPHDTSALIGRSAVWYEMEAYDKAMSDLHEVIRNGPDKPHGRRRVFVVSLFAGGGGANAAVKAEYEQGSILGTAYACRGVLWTRKKQFDRALADLNEAIRLAPEGEFGYSGRGFLKLEQGELDSAVEDLDHAVRLEPSDPRNYLVRGQVKVARKQYEQAIADYTEALRLSPRDSKAYGLRAQAWAEKQEYDKAIADCDDAIRLDPELAEVHVIRANVLVVVGKLDEAIAESTEAIRLEPKRSDFHTVRAQAYCQMHELDKAIADCNDAIRFDPRDADAFETRAKVWIEMHELDKVIADCSAAIRLDPKRVSAYFGRGCAHSSQREYDKAIEDFTEVIRLDPKNDDAQAALVWNRQQKITNPSSETTAESLVRRGQDSYTKNRRAERFEVKDQRKEIDDFFGAAPLEHSQNLVLDEPAAPSAIETLAASHSEDLVSAPATENAIASGLTGGTPAGDNQNSAETLAFLSPSTDASAKQKQIQSTFSTAGGGTGTRVGIAEHGANADLAVHAPGRQDPFLWKMTENPRTAAEFVSRAEIWLHGQKFDNVIADCDAALRLGSSDQRALIFRGVAWLGKGELNNAINDLGRVIEIDPRNRAAYWARGYAHQRKGGYQSALADYEQCARFSPIEPSAHIRLAHILAACPDDKVRDGKKAVALATNACELSGYATADYVDTLAAAYAETGDFTAAVKWQAKAIELESDPKQKEEYHARLKLYQEKKPYREARP
jgi:tetratricopeptide (TPR) repeat protein